MEIDEGMFYLGLLAASQRLPFLPTRAGLGSDVLRVNPGIRTVRSPYEDGEELVAMPALPLDAAFVHLNRADTHGNGQVLGPDPFFDELFLGAAARRFVTAEKVVEPGRLLDEGPLQTVTVTRLMTDAVAEVPGGAHFTACVPDYERDEPFQKAYAAAAADPDAWAAFEAALPAGRRGGLPRRRARGLGGAPVSSLVSAALEVTRAEVCAVACAEAWRGDGEVMASPFGTVPQIGARLARLTFEPDLVLTDGEAALMANTPSVSSAGHELVLEAWMPYRRVFDVVWSGRRHIMMMASQVDRFGNQNLSAIGDWARPKAQLIGVRGAPGNSLNHPTSYWVPAHTPRSFVEHVDMVCGVGYDRAAAAGPSATRFHDVRLVVSNLGVFDFETPDHAMRVRSVHPGVAVEDVVVATGFDLVVPDPVPLTPLPTAEELELIREVLDPDRLRDKEVPS